ncbi:Hypothetical protein CINCED_3A004007 [Cinara cedri]|uniref:Uncharacterized protein n=1 Tax=Cinara cedri TaxID=506608 RepID=A0A5E4MUL8_9HEMI|nr:Hypothetical protein CINCED_3A004007 [Cinara cedri]
MGWELYLLPRDNLKTARDSLPGFSGKKEEDPAKFLCSVCEMLEEAKILKRKWIKVVAPQLKAEAGT